MNAYAECARDVEPSSAAPEELERLGDEIAGLAAHLHAAVYRLLVRLVEFDQRFAATGGALGFLSSAHWLSWRTGIDLGAAREKVRVARALPHLPRFAEAMESGELSYSKVRALTRIATPAIEEELLELARHATASQVEAIVRAWRRVDRVAEAEQEGRRHEARHLSVYADEDGSYVVRGRLDPEVGALFQRALETAAMALLEGDRGAAARGRIPTDVSEGELERPASVPIPMPSIAQRRADALGLLIELAVANAGAREEGSSTGQHSTGREVPPSGGHVASSTEDSASATTKLPSRSRRLAVRRLSRVQVVLHVDAEALRDGAEVGRSVLAGGTHLSAETSRRLSCDGCRVVMTHDALGRALNVGRSRRTIPVPIRRALEHRDRWCRFPGCTNRITDGHHIRHWADGGETRLENLLLLCPRHHRLVHEGGYRVRRMASGDVGVIDPYGGLLPVVPPVPVRSAPPIPFDSANRVGTVGSGGPHGRLDVEWAMRVLYRSPSDRGRGELLAAPV